MVKLPISVQDNPKEINKTRATLLTNKIQNHKAIQLSKQSDDTKNIEN